LLKSWDNENDVAATIVYGQNGDFKNEADHIHFRMNKKKMRYDEHIFIRNKDKSRVTCNAILNFREEVVAEYFPWRYQSVICELEMEGMKDNVKYSFAIPNFDANLAQLTYNKIEKKLAEEAAEKQKAVKPMGFTLQELIDEKQLPFTNLLSIKQEIFAPTYRIVEGSQAVYIDEEKNSDNGVYHPRIFIRFLRQDYTMSKAMRFFLPYFVLWVCAIFTYAYDLDDGSYAGVISSLILTLVAGAPTFIDDQSSIEIFIFSIAVLGFVLMLLPGFKQAVFLPFFLFLVIPINGILRKTWLAKYVDKSVDNKEKWCTLNPTFKAAPKTLNNFNFDFGYENEYFYIEDIDINSFDPKEKPDGKLCIVKDYGNSKPDKNPDKEFKAKLYEVMDVNCKEYFTVQIIHNSKIPKLTNGKLCIIKYLGKKVDLKIFKNSKTKKTLYKYKWIEVDGKLCDVKEKGVLDETFSMPREIAMVNDFANLAEVLKNKKKYRNHKGDVITLWNTIYHYFTVTTPRANSRQI
jgi:hypothetical protein